MKTFAILLCAVLLAPALHAEPTGVAKQLIDHFQMQRIPDEGPWFNVTYVSADLLPGTAVPARYHGKPHAAGSAIYCLLTREDFSALHRLQTDETWHFYGGSPLEMLLLFPDGHGETLTLGPDVLAGQRPQFTVPRGVWQGSAPTGTDPAAYSFVGTQLAPAFDYGDFEAGYREELQKFYPPFAAQIARLTRDEFSARPTPPKPTSEIAQPAAAVFAQDGAKSIEAGPGMVLRELVGRAAVSKSERYSVAAFALEKGHGTGTSYNKVSEETFLVLHGHGQVVLEGSPQAVGPGTVVTIPPGVKHSLQAAEAEGLEFYALEAPAFQPEDYVVEK